MRKITGLLVAMLFVSVTFSQTKTEIKTPELSKVISSYIAKNFSGYTIDKAFKIDSKGTLSTQVMVSKGSDMLSLTFDKEFKLTKKEAMKPDMKTPPGKEERKPLPPVKEKK